MNIARAAGAMSKDRSTKVGCLIVSQTNSALSWGYNGFPRGIKDDVEERHERPAKYLWTEHAERNAIYNAARSGASLLNSKMYVTELILCPDCARAAIQAGVTEIIIESKALSESSPRAKAWLENWEMTKTMLEEAGVTVRVIDSGNV